MPDVSRALIDRYTALVRSASKMGTAILKSELANLRTDSASQLRAVVRSTVAAADAEVSEIDRQYYAAASMQATGTAPSNPRAITTGEWEAEVDRAVDAMLAKYGTYDPEEDRFAIDEAEYDRFETDMAQMFGRVVNDRSKHYVEVYGSRDPRTVRYARVPSGMETCAWCWSLAGLGFQYKSAETASHSHANCDCAIVPSWDDSGAEGYDPDMFADMFRAARADLRDGNVSEKVRESIGRARSAARRNGTTYTSGWNDVLAVMREKYGLT